MPGYCRFAGSVLAACVAIFSFVAADCPDLPGCDALGPPPIGNPGGLDPKDPNALGVYALNCPCYVGEVLDCSVTYTLTDGQTVAETTRTTVGFANSESTIIYSFTQAATAIQSGSPISIQFGARGANYPFVSQIYSPVPSIFYTDATTTNTQTSTETTTSTSTLQITSTSIIPQQTSTSDCTTGTSTVIAPTSTQRVTSTITPAPKTITKTSTVKTTRHASCFSWSGKARRSPQERREEYKLLDARQAPFVAETLWFPDAYGPPQTTYITTSTVTQQATTTTTSTAQAVATNVNSVVITPTPLTTTVCNNVAATTTSTPVTSSTVLTTLKPSTATTTKTVTATIVTYPHYPPPLCRDPPSWHHHSPNGHVLKLPGH